MLIEGVSEGAGEEYCKSGQAGEVGAGGEEEILVREAGGEAPRFGSGQAAKVRPASTHLETREAQLWRVSLWFLVLLAVGLGALAWEVLVRGPSAPLGTSQWPVPGGKGVAAGVVVVAALFAVYVWQKKRELAELRGFVRGMQARAEAPATLEQVEQLAEILRKSQEGYRDLIDSFQDSVFALGLDGTIRAANREFAELFGRPFSELVGRRISEFVDEPRLDGPGAAHSAGSGPSASTLAKFSERRHWTGVVRVQFKEKPEPRYFECVLHAIVKGGEVVGAAGLARDVTQQRESEARFTELFETLQEGVYFTTPDGKLLDTNPALVKMLGYASKEELLATNVTDLYADSREREQVIGELEEKARVGSREIVLKRKDGRLVRCLDTSVAIRGASGRVERYQGTLVDVTEKREMEERLQREQEFARRLVESFPDLIVVLDREGKYTYVSPRSEEVLGYKPEELLGRTLGERSEPEDVRAMHQLFGELVTAPSREGTGGGIHPESALADRATPPASGFTPPAHNVHSLEYRTRRKDGNWRVFRATASPLWDAQGQVIGVIASARDVTEVKRLEEQVIQSEKLAAMGQMIAGVTHELNNPLTAILGIAELVKEEVAKEASGPAPPPLASDRPAGTGQPVEKIRKQMDLLHQQARRASEIVQNLLAYARPKTGKKAQAELGELVRRALALHDYALRVNNIRVHFEPLSGLLVEGDPNQFMQVFLNLLMNAEQAITEQRTKPADPSAPPAANIRVRMGERDEHYWVEFEDDGPGIAAETLPKIFDPFFTTKRPGRGTGLGLSICLAIVKEHGGRIEVESPPLAPRLRSGQAHDTKGGTLFRVVLPRSKRVHVPRPEGRGEANTGRRAPYRTVAGRAGGAGRQLAGKKILVVDDEESIRELVREGLLRHAGDTVRVDCVASAEEALECLRPAPSGTGDAYDLVLCDLKMPGIGGHRLFEALRSVCGAGKTPAFVFMTGDVADPATQEFLRSLPDGTQLRTAGVDPGPVPDGSGAGRVLLKPFRIADLVAALGSALEAEEGVRAEK